MLSGGGMKGLAHVGVLRALEQRGLEPTLLVGSSVGALVAAGWASGLGPNMLAERALQLQRHDLFRLAHLDMALRRLRSPALYRAEPLQALVHELLGTLTFRQLQARLLVNTVDLNAGAQVLWGLPGLDDIPVADAVFASCALPGIFPPREIRGRHYVDGAIVENLPVRLSAMAGTGPVIAVNLNSGMIRRRAVETQGFAATYTRGLELVMRTQMEGVLRRWSDPPLVLVHPRVEQVGMFSFEHTPFLIEEGHRAMAAALDALDALPGGLFALENGVYPRRAVRISIDAGRCIGCGECGLWAPRVFRGAPGQVPEVLEPRHEWSPIDGSYVQHCPVEAIRVDDAD
ncbi:MAG: patatin-like phospholipase family protein [Gemmatimonadales bacterium]|nr:patatin-like phospholipase family protein [Gemmatimonadales bacterium]